MRWRQVLALVYLMGLGSASVGQTYNVPLNNVVYYGFEADLYRKGCEFHTSMKPYRMDDLNRSIRYDSLRTLNHHHSKFSKSFIGRKIVSRSLLQLDSSRFTIAADLVFNFELGRDFVGKYNYLVNTKGARLFGRIGKRVSYYSAIFETQATFMPYMVREIKARNVVPGFGRAKDFPFNRGLWQAFKSVPNGYDFALVQGYVSYSATRWLNVQLGHDRFMIGDGYRSLFLSDAGFNYPFVKAEASFWKMRYTMLWNSLQDISIPVPFESGFVKKWGSFHYLSYNATPWLQAGLFGAVVWGRGKSNGVGGLNLRFRPFNRTIIYGQLLIDDLAVAEMFEGSGHMGQKVGLQLGTKVHAPFRAKGLMLQMEYNTVRPYTYASSDRYINYGHYNQALAHPLGANFHELVGILHYRFKDIAFVYKLNYAVIGRDTSATSFGADINKPTTEAALGQWSYGNTTGQGIGSTVLMQDINLSYTVNRVSNFYIILGLQHRQETTAVATEKNVYVYFALRTMLSNLYNDY